MLQQLTQPESVEAVGIIIPSKLDTTESILPRLAREACAMYPNDGAAAKSHMKGVILADAELLDAVLDRLAASAVGSFIDHRRYDERRVVKQVHPQAMRTPNPSFRNADTIRKSGDLQVAALLETWSMPNGKMLGDCTGAELMKESEGCSARATGLTKNAMFYEALGEKLRPDQVVRSKITNEQARSLWREINSKEV